LVSYVIAKKEDIARNISLKSKSLKAIAESESKALSREARSLDGMS
jgi:hypothetical protein